MAKTTDKINELEDLRHNILDYVYLINRSLNKKMLTNTQKGQMAELHEIIGRQVGHCAKLITELTELKTVDVHGKDYDMWVIALRIPIDKLAFSALTFCLQVMDRAIGQLEEDIKSGIRDNQGKLVESQRKFVLEPPRAFIAHEGETEQLRKLKDFLEALGIEYFIAEAKASDGRSIERQVDWTQAKADFAICLATKGKAINRKTGKHYMGLNIADELGRARQVFRNRIILLVQKGVEVHTNIKEIVYAPFTTQSMDIAFTKVIKELRNWGFIKVGKIEE